MRLKAHFILSGLTVAKVDFRGLGSFCGSEASPGSFGLPRVWGFLPRAGRLLWGVRAVLWQGTARPSITGILSAQGLPAPDIFANTIFCCLGMSNRCWLSPRVICEEIWRWEPPGGLWAAHPDGPAEPIFNQSSALPLNCSSSSSKFHSWVTHLFSNRKISNLFLIYHYIYMVKLHWKVNNHFCFKLIHNCQAKGGTCMAS